MSRRLFVLVILSPFVHALLRPLLPGRATVRRAGSKGDQFKPGSNQQRGAGTDRDADPYAFLADADLAASYSEKDSWAEGAATLLVGVDLPGAA